MSCEQSSLNNTDQANANKLELDLNNNSDISSKIIKLNLQKDKSTPTLKTSNSSEKSNQFDKVNKRNRCYTCTKCGYETKYAASYQAHILSKYPCDMPKGEGYIIINIKTRHKDLIAKANEESKLKETKYNKRLKNDLLLLKRLGDQSLYTFDEIDNLINQIDEYLESLKVSKP